MGWRDGGILAQKYGIGKDRNVLRLSLSLLFVGFYIILVLVCSLAGREMKVHGTCICNLLITKQKKSGPPVHNVVLITVRSTASWHWQVTPSINPAIPQLPDLLSLDFPMTFLMLFVQRFYIPRQRHFRRRQLGLLIVEHG